MKINVGINGYGRIGRNILRAVYESNRQNEINIVAINDPGDNKISAHLTKYDTAHGLFNQDVSADKDHLIVGNHKILMTSERDPSNVKWKDIDVVYECTGRFTTREKASVHIKNGAKKVIISAPGDDNVDATIVYGVNHNILKNTDEIISNASCTTNCIAPVIKVLNDTVGIEKGLLTTIHSFTNDQRLIDANHKDIRRARSAVQSIIPTKTGAAKAVGVVIPELKGKFDGYAMRVPLVNVSLVDLVFTSKKDTSHEEINKIMKDSTNNEMQNIILYNDIPLVSSDFNHVSASGIYDANLTKVIDKRLVKVFTWYDNEWGFSNRMIDTTIELMKAN
ncbi:MAG: type I glyceraldehyde-3-phosphate dehydrogenase [Gammaproteobacteria bacterium]|nr:type I glyceraldehyde-3-phosphate dehydrogenase [Gammaproteobacteria bacterium]|tara:strand:+ start:2667 stop:3674 length:1008 start_codon:yes stop_codon:yes gene_type:complete